MWILDRISTTFLYPLVFRWLKSPGISFLQLHEIQLCHNMKIWNSYFYRSLWKIKLGFGWILKRNKLFKLKHKQTHDWRGEIKVEVFDKQMVGWFVHCVALELHSLKNLIFYLLRYLLTFIALLKEFQRIFWFKNINLTRM